ncbi:MAG: type II toxin-antitoxin system HicA family toxin [Planctomycetota bacterium]
MSLPPELPCRRVEKALNHFGYYFSHQKGSHRTLVKSGSNYHITTVAPTMQRVTLVRSLKKCGIDVAEFTSTYNDS